MSWLHYLLEANLYLSVFYLGYLLFLSKDTHYNLNRAYLLSACMLAFVIPFLHVGYLKPVVLMNNISPVMQGTYTTVALTPVTMQAANANSFFTWQNSIIIIYMAGLTTS